MVMWCRLPRPNTGGVRDCRPSRPPTTNPPFYSEKTCAAANEKGGGPGENVKATPTNHPMTATAIATATTKHTQ